MLSDPEKKKLYDQFGHAAFDGSAGAVELTVMEVNREAAPIAITDRMGAFMNIILKAAIWMTS